MKDETKVAETYVKEQKHSKQHTIFMAYIVYKIIVALLYIIDILFISGYTYYVCIQEVLLDVSLSEMLNNYLLTVTVPTLIVSLLFYVQIPIESLISNMIKKVAQQMPEPEHKQTIYRIHFSLPSSSSRSALTIAGTLVDNGIQFPESEIEQNIILEMKESEYELIQFDETGFSIYCRKM